MKILAFDQASRTTGWSLFENSKLIKYGKFTYDETDFGQRLVSIRNKILDLITEYKPDKIYFEDIQLQNSVGNNVETYKKLAEVYGVLSELATELQIPNESVISSVWKASLKIKGYDRAAQKKAAQDWVIAIYNMKPTQDEVDAICIGVYGSQKEASNVPNPHDWTK